MRSLPNIFVDFDGTISLQDTTDALLERFAEPAWLDVEADWVEGRIGSSECLRRQVELLRISPEALHAYIASVRIDPGFSGFLALARSLDLPVTIVSDGLDLIIHGALREAGVSVPVVANRLVWKGEDRWSLEFPNASAVCAAGHCKCLTLADRGSTILIGDGRSDYCAAEMADFVFAKSSLVDHCRDHGVSYEAFSNFRQLTPHFAAFMERLRIDAPAPAERQAA
ncbi:MAG: MtnX-like HAD-IB family phosphatase [Hansschlegelia sp.]